MMHKTGQFEYSENPKQTYNSDSNQEMSGRQNKSEVKGNDGKKINNSEETE